MKDLLKCCEGSLIFLLQQKSSKIYKVIYALLLTHVIEISFFAGGPRVTWNERRKGMLVFMFLCR